MYQHIDLMAAQSMAHERERELQKSLRQRGSADGARPAHRPGDSASHGWLHDMLVRAHVLHAPAS